VKTTNRALIYLLVLWPCVCFVEDIVFPDASSLPGSSWLSPHSFASPLIYRIRKEEFPFSLCSYRLFFVVRRTAFSPDLFSPGLSFLAQTVSALKKLFLKIRKIKRCRYPSHRANIDYDMPSSCMLTALVRRNTDLFRGEPYQLPDSMNEW